MRKRIEDYGKILPVLELYRAVQSEGSRFGRPTVVVRTTGCTHRCYFGEGGWCDSWYTSIHPEKGQYSFNDIIKFYDKNPHVKEMMLTGGSPTMHPALVNELHTLQMKETLLLLSKLKDLLLLKPIILLVLSLLALSFLTAFLLLELLHRLGKWLTKNS